MNVEVNDDDVIKLLTYDLSTPFGLCPQLHLFLANERPQLILAVLEQYISASILPNFRWDDYLDIEDKNLLLLAAKMGPVASKVTKFMLENICRFGESLLSQKDNHGRTIMHYLYLYADQELLELAREKCASEDISDDYGRKPIDYLGMDDGNVLAIAMEVALIS